MTPWQNISESNSSDKTTVSEDFRMKKEKVQKKTHSQTDTFIFPHTRRVAHTQGHRGTTTKETVTTRKGISLSQVVIVILSLILSHQKRVDLYLFHYS